MKLHRIIKSRCPFRCVSSCSGGVEKAQRYVQSELERVQGRLQRCVMDCNDSVKDKMPPNPNETEIGKKNSNSSSQISRFHFHSQIY